MMGLGSLVQKSKTSVLADESDMLTGERMRQGNRQVNLPVSSSPVGKENPESARVSDSFCLAGCPVDPKRFPWYSHHASRDETDSSYEPLLSREWQKRFRSGFYTMYMERYNCWSFWPDEDNERDEVGILVQDEPLLSLSALSQSYPSNMAKPQKRSTARDVIHVQSNVNSIHRFMGF